MVYPGILMRRGRRARLPLLAAQTPIRRYRLQRLREGLRGLLDELDSRLGDLDELQEDLGRSGGPAPFRTAGFYEEPPPGGRRRRAAEDEEEDEEQEAAANGGEVKGAKGRPPKRPPRPRRRR